MAGRGGQAGIPGGLGRSRQSETGISSKNCGHNSMVPVAKGTRSPPKGRAMRKPPKPDYERKEGEDTPIEKTRSELRRQIAELRQQGYRTRQILDQLNELRRKMKSSSEDE